MSQILGRRRRGRPPSSSRSFHFLALLALAGTILFAASPPRLLAQGTSGTPPPPGDGDFNATGITGIFNGNVTTGCSYDPLTGNAKRVVTDLVVAGSVGKYPLKMVRYYDSRHSDFGAGLGPGWGFEYSWGISSGDVSLPNGNVYNFSPCGPAPGVSEHWEVLPNLQNPVNGQTAVFRLADGGKLTFTYDGTTGNGLPLRSSILTVKRPRLVAVITINNIPGPSLAR